MEAVIYIGHGNRSVIGQNAFEKFIQKTMNGVHTPIKEYCFYERAEPTLANAIDACAQKGATNILVIPVLLLPGKQTSEDIPNDLKFFQEKYPEININFRDPIGADPVMLKIVSDRLRNLAFAGSDKEAVVLVSHGSHDPIAAKEFNRIANVLSHELKVPTETGYLVTQPNYRHVTEELLKKGVEKVYMIPYFFFAGIFLEEMKTAVADNEKIVVCDELGYDEEIIRLLVEKAK